MNVLLISANTESINMPVAPLGMACVAAAAEQAGHDVISINLMAQSDAMDALGPPIETIQPDVIGISVRNIDDQVSANSRLLLEPAKDIVSICRKHSGAHRPGRSRLQHLSARGSGIPGRGYGDPGGLVIGEKGR